MNQIRTSALIGLGALGILFGRKMPGVQFLTAVHLLFNAQHTVFRHGTALLCIYGKYNRIIAQPAAAVQEVPLPGLCRPGGLTVR